MKEPTDHLRRYGEDIASSVSPARSRVAAMRAIGQAHRTPTPRRTPQFAFGAVGVLLVANVATAGVANAAVPGDVLYPVDRGYERVMDFVGLADDHSEERIEEAGVLIDRGDLAGATDLVAEATDNDLVLDAALSLQAGAPSDSRFSESVEALVASARHLVAARAAGEASRVAEAEAALDLAAMQVSDASRPGHSGEPGPPSHADEQGPPDHARDDDNPGRDDTPAADPPGQSGNPPGQSEDPPGQSENPPGQSENPGQTGDSGQSEDPPGQSEDPPGQSEDPPGQSGNPPGQSEDPPGQSGNPPGQSEDPPGQSGNQGQTGDSGQSESRGQAGDPPDRAREGSGRPGR